MARRFALEFLPYAPGSSADVKVDNSGVTPVGTYLTLTVVRTTAKSDRAAEQLGMLLDPAQRTAAVGLIFPLPATQPPITPDRLPTFVEQLLPQAVGQILNSHVRVPWPEVPSRLTPVVALTASISTGYGTMTMPIAVTADGRWLAIGATWPLDRDPREVRREILAKAPIQWDPGHENAPLKVVEFSDYECPACKRGWSEVKPIFESFGDKLRHGLVNFPLVNNHPWAFRAAVAGACIGSLWPDKLVPFKEEMYRLQDSLTVETVDDAVFGFLTQQSLAEKAFRACYLKDPSLDRVLRGMDVGNRLGVMGTPTYYVNGESMPFGEKEWTEKRMQAILANGGRPEGAAEIVWTPPPATPTPAPTKSAS